MQWSPDGRSLVFSKSTNAMGPMHLMRVSVSGGPPEPIGIEATELWKFDIHPDGRRIDYVANQKRFEVWAMENSIPKQ